MERIDIYFANEVEKLVTEMVASFQKKNYRFFSNKYSEELFKKDLHRITSNDFPWETETMNDYNLTVSFAPKPWPYFDEYSNKFSFVDKPYLGLVFNIQIKRFLLHEKYGYNHGKDRKFLVQKKYCY